MRVTTRRRQRACCRLGGSEKLRGSNLTDTWDEMAGQTPSAREPRDEVAGARPVSRMSLSQRGRIVRALDSLSGSYELERIDGQYHVTRDGRVLQSIGVYRCEDGLHLFVGGVPYV